MNDFIYNSISDNVINVLVTLTVYLPFLNSCQMDVEIKKTLADSNV